MKPFVILGTIVLIVVAAWTGVWFYAASEIRTQVASLGGTDGVTAPSISCAGLNITGYPFRFDIACTEAVIVDGDISAGLPELRASAMVYNPTHVRISALAPLELADAFSGQRSRVSWSGLEMSVRLADWRIARASLVADAAVWTDTLAGETEIGRAEHLELHLLDIPEQHDDAAGTAALAAYGTMTGVESEPLAITGGETVLEAEITGLPDDVRAFGEPGALQRWQEAGGQIRLTGLRGSDEAHTLDADGTLSLDSAGRLDGQVSISSRGLVERFGTFIPEEFRVLILGNPAADGTYSQTLNLRSGIVFAGLVPAGMVPPLW